MLGFSAETVGRPCDHELPFRITKSDRALRPAMAVRRFAAVLSKTIRDSFNAVPIRIAEDSQTKVHCVLKGFVEFSRAMSSGHLLNRCSRYHLQPGFGPSATLQHLIKPSQFPNWTTETGTRRRLRNPWGAATTTALSSET